MNRNKTITSPKLNKKVNQIILLMMSNFKNKKKFFRQRFRNLKVTRHRLLKNTKTKK